VTLSRMQIHIEHGSIPNEGSLYVVSRTISNITKAWNVVRNLYSMTGLTNHVAVVVVVAAAICRCDYHSYIVISFTNSSKE